MAIIAGEKATAVRIEREIGGIVARAARTTNKTGVTTEAGVLRLDNIPIISGRTYLVLANPEVTSTVTGDGVYVRIRFRTDGTAATTADGVLPGCTSPHRIPNATNGEGRLIMSDPYIAGSDQTMSLILTLERYAGTGTVSVTGGTSQPLSIVVLDVGDSVSNGGVSL